MHLIRMYKQKHTLEPTSLFVKIFIVDEQVSSFKGNILAGVNAAQC